MVHITFVMVWAHCSSQDESFPMRLFFFTNTIVINPQSLLNRIQGLINNFVRNYKKQLVKAWVLQLKALGKLFDLLEPHEHFVNCHYQESYTLYFITHSLKIMSKVTPILNMRLKPNDWLATKQDTLFSCSDHLPQLHGKEGGGLFKNGFRQTVLIFISIYNSTNNSFIRKAGF